MAGVEFDNISKRFENGTQAVKAFNLSIDDGELVVLVGPSGCGKTTVLRMLAGLEAVSEGEIRINGKPVNQATPQQRNVAMVFQNYALYPHMTVRANLEFPLRMSHAAKDQINARISEIADILQLAELMDRKPGQLSGGQRQRVAMGRALVRDPSVFLLDEPLSNLDARLRAHIRAEIARIQRRFGKTTVYVTHDQVEAMTLGDRVVVLDHGESQQIGTPQTLYDRPQNIFVARFIGSPGMNILRTRVVGMGNEQIGIELGDQQVTLPVNRHCHERLAPFFGQDIYTGIRPEAFSFMPVQAGVNLKIYVDTVEFLGHETLVYFNLTGPGLAGDGQPLIARLHGRVPGSDNGVHIYIRPDAFCYFNREGQNILA